MKKLLLAAAIAVCLSGCGDQGGGPDAWQESLPLSNLTFTELRQSDHHKVSGVITNLTGSPVALARIYFKGYAAGDVLLDETTETVTNLGAGKSASFTVFIDDAGQKVVRWEYWVEWQTEFP